MYLRFLQNGEIVRMPGRHQHLYPSDAFTNGQPSTASRTATTMAQPTRDILKHRHNKLMHKAHPTRFLRIQSAGRLQPYSQTIKK
jgi:hypothetical protein